MTATCVQCGDSFEAARSTARYCSTRCKRRWQRTSGGATGEPAAPREESQAVYAAVVRDLERVGQLETVLGQAALVLARQLDSGRDTGSSAAAVSKELDRLMARLVRQGSLEETPLDRVRRLREEKRRASGGSA